MNKKITKLKHVNFNHYHDKKEYNLNLFNIVAPKYNYLTKVLSLGQDHAWKNKLIQRLPSHIGAPHCLDIACGTGDITFALSQKYPAGEIIGIDLNEKMIQIASSLNSFSNINFKITDMCQTGFDNEQFDIITGGYALRNAPDLKIALNEFYRIMRPGATAAFLDFSKSDKAFLQKAEYAILKTWGSIWGWALHGNPEIYAYIAESLKFFPDNKTLHQMVLDTGFKNIKKHSLFSGYLELLIFEK